MGDVYAQLAPYVGGMRQLCIHITHRPLPVDIGMGGGGPFPLAKKRIPTL